MNKRKRKKGDKAAKESLQLNMIEKKMLYTDLCVFYVYMYTHISCVCRMVSSKLSIFGLQISNLIYRGFGPV